MRVRGNVPAAVLWLCALHLVLLVGHSLLVPAWLGPDEPNHADLVVALREDRHYPAYDDRDLDPGIRASLERFEFRRHARHLTADEAPPRGGRPSRDDLAEEGESLDLGALGRPGTRNHMSQHPPGYYAALAGLADAVDIVMPGEGLGSVDHELGVLRLLSLLAAVPLPLVAWWVAHQAGLSPRVGLAAAVVPLAVPQLTHIAAVVNSDGLLVLAFGILTGLVLRIARGAVDTLILAVAGLVTGGALFVKAFAFVVPVWVLAAFVVGRRRAVRPKHFAERETTGWHSWAPPVAAYAAASLAAGGWWWVANLVRYGDISPSIEYATRFSDPDPGFRPDLGEWVRNWVPNMMQRYWGEFGWIDVALAGPVVVAATAFVVVGVAVASGRAVRDRRAPGRVSEGRMNRADGVSGADGVRGAGGAGRGVGGASAAGGPQPGLGLVDLALLLAPTGLLVLFVGANGYRLYREAGFGAMVQGRYLFGGLVGLAVVVAAGWSCLSTMLAGADSGRWSRLAASTRGGSPARPSRRLRAGRLALANRSRGHWSVTSSIGDSALDAEGSSPPSAAAPASDAASASYADRSVLAARSGDAAGSWVAVWFLVGALVVQVVAVLSMLDFWWGVEDASLSERLDVLVAWSPWPTWVVRAVFVVLPALAALTLGALVRDARRAGPGQPQAGGRTGEATVVDAGADGTGGSAVAV